MLHYCERCGRIVENSYSQESFKCDCCSSITRPVPREFLDKELDCFFKDDDTKGRFIEDYIKTSPVFDQYLFDHRSEILAKKSAEFKAAMAHGKAIREEKNRVAKCPSCGSANVSKIGAFSRMVSTGIFGLASSKIGKTHKCNNCGTTW